jgi:hypothetical protein
VEINTHLTQEQIAERVLNSAPHLGSHAEHCDSCLNDITHLRDLTHDMRKKLDENEVFWSQQRRAIQTRVSSIRAAKDSGSPQLSWALAAATVVIAVALFQGVETPAPPVSQLAVDPDHELLLEVERALQTGGPEALEPASLLVREISQQAPALRRNIYQEKTHAN